MGVQVQLLTVRQRYQLLCIMQYQGRTSPTHAFLLYVAEQQHIPKAFHRFRLSLPKVI